MAIFTSIGQNTIKIASKQLQDTTFKYASRKKLGAHSQSSTRAPLILPNQNGVAYLPYVARHIVILPTIDCLARTCECARAVSVDHIKNEKFHPSLQFKRKLIVFKRIEMKIALPELSESTEL